MHSLSQQQSHSVVSFIIKFFVVSVFSLLISVNSYAAAEALPNKAINAKEAKALAQAKNDSVLGKLKKANAALTTKNTTLTQENNALQTQVNVLAAERSNQIFLTGSFVAIGGIFLGFIAAWLLVGRKNGSDW